VHGQDARYVFGKAPYSLWKIVGVIAAGIGLLLVILGVALAIDALQ
jgi:hypothetical protein